MQNKTSKKGFTITELVIVIVVIAILAAVLIPTFASLINKANQSADIQAVRQMNTVLAAEIDTPTNIVEVATALKEAGFNTEKGLTPVYENHSFYWFKPTNQVVYVNEADGAFELVFPKDVKDFPAEKTGDCQSLAAGIAAVMNAPTVAENSTTVGSTLAVTSHTVPEDLTTFESVIDWVNSLEGHQTFKCTVNGAEKSGISITGDIKLSEDIVIDVYANSSTMPINVVGETTIDLNGYSITQKGQRGTSISLFIVRDGATLNIIDSSAEQTGSINVAYTAFQVDTGSTVNIYSGTIGVSEYRPDSNDHAGPQLVFLYGGTFNMYGGKLDATDPIDNDGNAIGSDYYKASSACNLYAGEIIGVVAIENIPTFNNYGIDDLDVVTGE